MKKHSNRLLVEVFIYTIAKLLYIPVGPAWHDSRILFFSSSLLAHIFYAWFLASGSTFLVVQDSSLNFEVVSAFSS